MSRKRRLLGTLAVLVFTVLALTVRAVMREATNGDLEGFLIPWYNYVVEHGGFRALRDPFSNYSPPYTYLLVLATYVRPWLPAVAAIKAISAAFDLAAAFVMYRLVRLRHPHGWVPWLAWFAVLFAPTVIVNSSLWGQCDVIYSTWLLASIYLLCRGRPLGAMICFGVALAFKAQALFLGPFILILLLTRQVPWRYLLLVPLVCLLLFLPAAAAGRPWGDLLTVYAAQAGGYRALCKSAPNLWALVPDANYASGVWVGLGVATAVAGALAWAARRSRAAWGRPLLITAATLSVAVMPLVLPKMHDRYFFPADLLSIALAFYCVRCRPLPLLFQFTSLAAYAPFLTGSEPVPVALAGLLNAAAAGYLALLYVHGLFPRPAGSAPARQPGEGMAAE